MERLDPVVRELTADLANANTQLEKETIEQKLKVKLAFICAYRIRLRIEIEFFIIFQKHKKIV